MVRRAVSDTIDFMAAVSMLLEKGMVFQPMQTEYRFTGEPTASLEPQINSRITV